MSHFVITLVLALSVVASNSEARPSSTVSCSKNYHFDFILLATQWPETFCESTHCVPHQDKWAIHGAWPENNDASWPSNCCTNHPFNAKLLEPIESELVLHWKTLKSSGTNNQFWAHEYSKHGTCAIESPLMKDELSYFKSTLDAFKKLSIEKWLSSEGIVPSSSKTYSLESFHLAIKKNLGHTAQIQCVKSNKHNFSVISQINFCLSKTSLTPFDCPSALKDRGCNINSIGYLPSHN